MWVSLLGNLQPPPEPEMRNGPQVRLHYHWRGLPQVSFLSWQTRYLSQQKYACRYKTFVVTKLRFSPQNSFVTTKDVFWLDKHSRDKRFLFVCFVLFCLSQQIFVPTKVVVFSRQKYVWRDKQTVVATIEVLSQVPPMIFSNRPSVWFKGSTQARRVLPPEEPPTWQPH